MGDKNVDERIVQDLSALDLDPLTRLFMAECEPDEIKKLAKEIGSRGDSIMLGSLCVKYNTVSSTEEKIAILEAIGDIATGASLEFFEGALRESDMTDDRLRAIFMAMCNDTDTAFIVNITSLGLGAYGQFHGWPEIAEDVIKEIYPAGFWISD